MRVSWIERLRDFTDPSRSLFLFFLGTAASTIALQYAYDSVREQKLEPRTGVLTIGMIVLVLISLGFTLRRDRLRQQLIIVEEPIAPHRGLIWMVSNSRFAVEGAINAVEHHADTIEHCWLVFTEDSREKAIETQLAISGRWPQLVVHADDEFIVDPYILGDTWQVVDRIYRKELKQYGLLASDVVADITGGPKPMTAGMVMGCLAADRQMQYVRAAKDEHGQYIQSTPGTPVQVKTSLLAAEVE